MKKLIATLGIASLLAARLAGAHPDHDAPPVKMKAVVLSAKATAAGASIRVTESGKAVSTAGASGTLTLLGTGGQQAIPLKPAGDNVLEAKTTAKIAPGTKGQASIVFGDDSVAIVDVTVN